MAANQPKLPADVVIQAIVDGLRITIASQITEAREGLAGKNPEGIINAHSNGMLNGFLNGAVWVADNLLVNEGAANPHHMSRALDIVARQLGYGCVTVSREANPGTASDA